MDSTESEDDQHHTGGVFNLTLGELLEIAGGYKPAHEDTELFGDNIHPQDAVESAFHNVRPWVAGQLIRLIGDGIENGNLEHGAATPRFKEEINRLSSKTANTGDPDAECPVCNSKNTYSPMQTANLPQIRSCLDCGDVLPASDFYPVNRSDSNRNFGEEWRDTTDILHPELISRASQSSGVITDVTEKGTAQIVRAVLDAGNRFYRCDIRWANSHSDDPRVSFKKCHPYSDAKVTRKWTSIATGRMSGPQEMEQWTHLMTVFDAARNRYQLER